jgi:DNA polymerase III alpha subunit (gram-positive type)
MKRFYLIIDTETGGLSPKENPVLEIAAKIYDDDGEERDNFYSTYQPYRSVECKALAINNVLQRRKESDNLTEVTNLIKWSSVVYQRFNPTLVGQNLKFDLDFIDSLVEYYGFKGWSRIWNYHTLDTMHLAFILREAGVIQTEKFNLAALAKVYGVENSAAHTADADVDTTAAIFFKMLEQLKKMKNDQCNYTKS